jgi:hypothetical protein
LSFGLGYWIARFLGGLAGAVALWGIFEGASSYTKSVLRSWFAATRSVRCGCSSSPPLLGGALAALAYWTLNPREVVLVAEGGVVIEEVVT